MSLGFVLPCVRRGRARFVLRGMLTCISDGPLLCVALDWVLGHSGARTDPLGAGMNGRIRQWCLV